MEDRDFVVIGKAGESSPFPRLFFDKQTGLLSKVGRVTAEDYREVEGVKVPFLAREGDQVVIRVKEVAFNAPLEDSLFEKPSDKSATRLAEAMPGPAYETLQSTSGALEIVRRPPVADFRRDRMEVLPRYDSDSSRQWQVDLRGYDLRQLDLSDRLNDLLHSNFDSRTHWPSSLPSGFDRDRIMELGKDPGLGIRELHRRGITGKGISVGIIDQTLLVDHVEYADRLRFYEEIHSPKNAPAQMHGPAVASIAVGRNVGVAPEADLYYIAEMHGTSRSQGDFEWDFTWLAQSIHRLLDVNARLPLTNKIRVISISVGWSPSQKGFAEAQAAVERAKREAVFVVSTSIEQSYRLAFHGLGRDALSDPNLAGSYGPGSWWAKMFWGGHQQFSPGKRLLVPMDSRCTASPTGTNDYVFYSSGGWSWSVPWISGLYALASQVRPDLTPEIFWAEALKTAKTIRVKHGTAELEFGSIADPVALIERLQNK
ncbi:MAG TPA: S8 family serine peptidase [Candidatus Paceibacterota bacterium]|nr:S8 family serine peptidase [Verrucomicrobiota bacterium]HRY50983.1 S8 family serine peptidase [Candidatus Paceibacterota bacterium]HSA01466.1 S8 family serine peptidase [Candidatus Paceibacterota bacterium]